MRDPTTQNGWTPTPTLLVASSANLLGPYTAKNMDDGNERKKRVWRRGLVSLWS